MTSKWKDLENRLTGLKIHPVHVQAGGHRATFRKRVYKERLVVEVFVDGEMKGAWMEVDENGAPRHSEGWFFRPERQRAWPLKEYKNLKKAFGKKEADRKTALRTFILMPYWNGPTAVVRHLRKHFPDAEIEPEEQPS